MANMKLAVVICTLASAVNTLTYQEPSVLDYFDFADIQKISPYESSREARARNIDTLASASERSNTGTYMSAPLVTGGSNRRSTAPIQPLRSPGREVYSRPINKKTNNQRRFTQKVHTDYDTASPYFNQPRFRPQQNYKPQRSNKPEFLPSEQYFPGQGYRPENSRPHPQFRKQPQTVPEHQYNPNDQYKPNTQYRPITQYRPKPQFISEPQFAPNFVAQIEEPIYQDSIDYQDSVNYQDSVDYQNLPITYEETPIIKTKKYIFDDEPSEIEDHSQYIEEALPYANEQAQYQDEYPQYDEVLPVYKDYVQEQNEIPVEVAETNRDLSQATVNALPVQDKQAQESAVIEKRQVGVHSDLDSAGQAFVADAAEVEHAKDAGRLSFQIHGQQGPHSYRFGYDTGKGYNRQFRYEERDGNGEVHGRYGFYDEHGKLKVVNYSAHPKHGFNADVPYDR